MMKIKITEKFFIEQSLHAPFHWDLVKVHYGNRNGKVTKVETPVAYGFTLEHLAKKFADYEMFESEIEQITFENYLKKYVEISQEFINKIKELKK